MEMSYIINPEGKAVPVKVVNGSAGGGISGKNIDNNEQINEVSFEVDADGYPVLRIIDAAPYGFNPIEDALDVNIKQKTMALKRLKYTVTVEAGDFKIIEGNLDVSEYRYLAWGASVDSSSTFRLETVLKDFEDNQHLHRLDRLESPYQETFTSVTGQIEEIQLQTTGVSLILRNQDTENPHTYNVYVYLRKC